MSDQLSINIAAASYPLAEMCVYRWRQFYPKIPIKVCLTPENYQREPFFRRYQVDVMYLEDRQHWSKLNYMVSECPTKYFLSCDDDICLNHHGVIERLRCIIDEHDPSVLGEIHPYGLLSQEDNCMEGIKMSRFDPAFLTFKTDVFIKHNMSFNRRWKEDFDQEHILPGKTDIFIDTGGFILLDVLRHKLPYCDFGYRGFAKHYRSLTYELFSHLRVNLLWRVSDKTIPRLDRDMFHWGNVRSDRYEDFLEFFADNNKIVDAMERNNEQTEINL